MAQSSKSRRTEEQHSETWHVNSTRLMIAGTASDPMLERFEAHMRTERLAEMTILKRVEILGRLLAFLGHPLLDATTDELYAFQRTFDHLSAASVNIYTRHAQAFYRWAIEWEHIEADPTRRMANVKVAGTVPHPTKAADLRVVFACARGRIRTAYVLAAFAGLRCAEICKARWVDLNIDAATPTLLVHGKGNKDRYVPLVGPVIEELAGLPEPHRGQILTRDNGDPLVPLWLSGESTRFLASIGIESTLHSMRAAFATSVARSTRDPMFVRDLLGHASVATTQIYIDTNLDGAHDKLAEFAEQAAGLLDGEIAWRTSAAGGVPDRDYLRRLAASL